MANPENLKRLSPKEAREMGRKGGEASVKARKQKKAIREFLSMLVSSPVSDEKQKELLIKNGLKEEESTNGAAVAMSIMKNAIKGNPKMAQMCLELLGESAPKKIELTGAGGGAVHVKSDPFDGMSVDELRKMAGIE